MNEDNRLTGARLAVVEKGKRRRGWRRRQIRWSLMTRSLEARGLLHDLFKDEIAE